MTQNDSKNGMPADLLRFWWVPGIGVAIVIALMLALRAFVRDVLALPVSHLLWLADLAFKSIPQFVCWMALVLMGLVIALKSLGRKKRVTISKTQSSPIVPGRVAAWTERIELLLDGKYSRHRFGYYIGRLILDVLSHEERLNFRDIERRIEQEQLVLPPEVHQYLMARLRPGLPRRPSFLARLKLLLGLENQPTSPLNRELDSVIRYLEEQTYGQDTSHDQDLRHNRSYHVEVQQ